MKTLSEKLQHTLSCHLPPFEIPGSKAKRFVFPALLLSLGIILLVVFLSDQWIQKSAAGSHSANVEEIPQGRVALVLGCSEYLGNGRRNLYFSHRINAALALYQSGRCRKFLVSGDNGVTSYNEPEMMKQALIRGGIPEENISCDYAGFRTLDSIVRAQKVFGLQELIVISQEFHNERAIFLAKQYGIDAFGYNATEVTNYSGLRTRLRGPFG